MHLWNEYEGRTVADRFPLIKLLEPEGRSAFFSTRDEAGKPAVLRLIEAHFDESEILARWTAVTKISQPNLIKLGKFGQTTLDETALLYIAMEPWDATLAGILTNRVLTADETMQIASSLVPALEAIHAKGLVHEHLEPANVLAVGEVVKLRSDCIREASEGREGDEARARDVRSLCTVLLQALTLQRQPAGANLPTPFQQIVSNGISGVWGLPEIKNALSPASVPSKQPAAAKPAKAIVETQKETPPPVQRVAAPVADIEEERRPFPKWAAIAAAVLVVLFVGWHFLHKPSRKIATLANMPVQAEPVSAASREPAPTPTATAPAESASTATGARTQWRVIAYTYNHEAQARDKAAQIMSKNVDLHPEVFAPKGHAPYLVTVGGAMDHDQAMAFRKKARAAGLPRDTYAQNFPAGAR
ncbi:MAG TPA: hypothetical protein VFE38_04155 [Edaphobacter sp.]|nr:hypothetical protein [Edaphobacter sp.]